MDLTLHSTNYLIIVFFVHLRIFSFFVALILLKQALWRCRDSVSKGKYIIFNNT